MLCIDFYFNKEQEATQSLQMAIPLVPSVFSWSIDAVREQTNPGNRHWSLVSGFMFLFCVSQTVRKSLLCATFMNMQMRCYFSLFNEVQTWKKNMRTTHNRTADLD
ncbi:unnamed protein product [Amoebophrya sp. A120]|nr:unnamed protein product [Amoebophrya sp. A120]|eukprot:GSA120T00025346001.1